MVRYGGALHQIMSNHKSQTRWIHQQINQGMVLNLLPKHDTHILEMFHRTTKTLSGRMSEAGISLNAYP